MAVYIFMSLSIILGIILLLDFFGYFSKYKEKFDVEIEDYATELKSRNINVNRTQFENRQNDKRKAA